MKPVKDCDHERLFFGSGAFYVFCRGCGARWVAAETNADVADYGPDRARRSIPEGDRVRP